MSDIPGLDILLHRISNCPQCTRRLQLLVEKEAVHLYCFVHGYFEIKYVNGDWSIQYKFPSAA